MSEESDKLVVSEEAKKKALVFFQGAKTKAQAAQYPYAFELYLGGIALNPESVEHHQELREYSLKYKVSGGKDLGMFEKMKLRYGKDDLANMVLAEKFLAFDPGNMGRMRELMQYAMKCNCHDTIFWITNILMRANAESPKPDLNTFLACKDAYVQIAKWQHATDAAQRALQLKPMDMDLQQLVKNLGAKQTMVEGGYESGGSFTKSVRDMDKQKELMQGDTDARTVDVLTQQINAARAELKADPNELGKITKLVDALVKTEDSEYENEAITLLEKTYERTKQFRFRQRVGVIKMGQLKRMQRTMLEQVRENPKDAALIKDYKSFVKDKLEFELNEFQLAAEAYPTDVSYKFESARRMLELERHSEAIPLLQQSVQDPKLKTDATIMLGRAFLDAEFVDEAVDTLKGLTESYQLTGDQKYKDIWYWYARSLETQANTPDAIKAYSKVAMADFNYKDVQARIKTLRAK